MEKFSRLKKHLYGNDESWESYSKSMMKFILMILLSICSIKTAAQHKIDIPEFRNINPDDKYPQNSILTTYLDRFDMLISLNTFSAWGPDHSIRVLAHHSSGWWKIEINSGRTYETNTVCLLMDQIKDSIGENIFFTLNQNHFFEMKDSRQIGIACITMDTIQYKKGKFRVDSVLHDGSSDGPEYKFEIITKTNYKQVYFYSPGDLVYVCPDPRKKMDTKLYYCF